MSAVASNVTPPASKETTEIDVSQQVRMPQLLASAAVAVAAIGALIYLVSALQYFSTPFVGLALDQDLTVGHYTSFTDDAWPGLEAGIQENDRILGIIEGGEVQPTSTYPDFREKLGDYNTDDTIILQVQRQGTRGIPGAESCPPDEDESTTICRVAVTLGTMPLVDFIGYFGIGFIAGILALGLSVFVLVQRFAQTSARFLASGGAALSAALIGVFNIQFMHVQGLTYLWIFGATMFAGVLLSFTLIFPSRILSIERLPILRYGPVVIGTLLSLLFFVAFTDGNTNILIAPPLLIAASILIMMMTMSWRRQYTTSPIFREQASYVTLGSVFGAFPMMIWLGYFLLNDGETPAWTLAVVQLTSLLFLVSVTYAIIEDRLLETDRLVPSIGVYTVLSGALILSYVAVVAGLSAIGVQAVESDNTVFIAMVVLVIALGFTPIRNRLNEQIEEIWFRRRRNYQRRLDDLAEKFSNAVTLNDVDSVIRNEVEATLSASEVVLFVRDIEGQAFRANENSRTARPVTDVVFPLDSGLATYLSSEQSVLYLEEGMMLPPAVMQNRPQLAILNAHVIVRLMGQRGELNGFIVLGGRRSGENYAYEDLQFIERVADQAALTLERTQIVEDLERRFQVQDVLSSISRSLSYAIDFDTLMELLYAQTSRVIDNDIFAVALVEQNFMYYAFFSTGEEREEEREGRRWQMGRDLLSEIAETQNVIRTVDYITTARQRTPNARLDFPNAKAFMAAPLTADTAVGTLGVMVLASTNPLIRYSDEQLQLFLDIASIAASAIDKTRLFEATQTRSQQLEALNAIANQLSTEISDVDRLLDLITRSALDILGCEAGSLLLEESGSEEIVFRVALGPGAQGLVGRRISKGEPSLVNEAIGSGTSIITNDTTQDARWHGEILDSDDEDTMDRFTSRTILTTPLITQGQAIGALQVLNKKDGSPFTNDDATLLTTFASQAAVAIKNAELYALQDERLIERVSELEDLAAIDQSLNKNLELTQVASITLESALKRCNAKSAMMASLNEEGGEASLVLLASKGYPAESILSAERVGSTIPLNQGIWGRVIRTRTPSFARNLGGDPDYVETLPGSVVQVVIPIRSAGAVLGVILLESDTETDLTLMDMDAIRRLVEHASPAIANSKLFEQLRQKERERSEFVRFVYHELGNPVTSIRGYTDLLMRGVVGPLNEQQSRFLETVFGNINRVNTLINDLRDLEQMDDPHFKMEMEQVSIVHIIRETYHTLEAAFQRKSQTVVMDVPDDLPEVWGDRTRLGQVMTNFMTNGNKYTPESGTITVKAEEAVNIWDKEGARRVVHVQVQDTGIGISDEDLKKLFNVRYFRTDEAKATEEPGTGLGMVLTRGLIEQHGGKVWVESVLDEGSTFHFTIPLADEVIRQAT
jgi:signal transduction histidine kinase/transcriptional regulator with GAF, ATPase, and Fis domain